MSSGKLCGMDTALPAPSLTQRSRRVQILDAALSLFGEHGVSNVTTRQIAKAVGISQPSLYAHFATREAICVAVCTRAFDTLYELLCAAVVPEDSPHERLIKMGRTYVHFGLNNEAAYRVAFMDEMGDKLPHDHPDGPTHDQAHDQIMSAGLRAFSLLKAQFDSVYGADSTESLVRAQSSWATLHGLVSLFIARIEFPWADHEALIEFHLTQYCRAALI